ncbi:MAG TPA: class I SAM-dependent methyltransferase [Rhodanobacteraceae bacterium]|nr:class I SAM-dependent methyltransferase [Rhodanobacteraceae bacterium]
MLRSWDSNAEAWAGAVREKRIASRRAGTDAAIVAAVLQTKPESVLDVGCGEGWLARELAPHGCRVVGIDASEALVESARTLGGGTFVAMTYDAIAGRASELGAPFDVAVCNFSLLEAELSPLLDALRGVLVTEGRLVIQTVHPWVACGDAPYVDGWREETFASFGGGFTAPMPWYFRTLASWVAAIGASRFAIRRVAEPVNAETGRPLSLLIEATRP